MLRSATQKKHDALAMLAKIDLVTGTKIDPALKNSRPNAFYIREVSEAQNFRMLPETSSGAAIAGYAVRYG
jgi:hypothetical protein